MKSICLLFLLVGISTALLDWKSKEKLRKSLAMLKSNLNVDGLLKIRERLNKYMKEPKLNAQQEVFLASVKKLRSVNISHGMTHTIETVNREAGMLDLLYQGDLVLTERQAEEVIEGSGGRWKRQAITEGDKKWLNGAPYSFRDGSTPVRIEFYEGKGCHSYVGHWDKVQELSLGKGCHDEGTAAHELAHTLGLYHVQSRYDRDDYITLNVTNIKKDHVKPDFGKVDENYADNYGIPYEYGSLMHYSWNEFAIDSDYPTIVPIDEYHYETMGTNQLSFYDILLVNKLYGCLVNVAQDDKCKSATSQKCKMGGYPNPRDCSKCICPGGYGGRLCDQRPSGCGEVLTAKNNVQILDYVFGTKKDDQKCHFWIKADKGRKVEIKIKDLQVEDGNVAGIEIKSQENQMLTGYRMYSKEAIGSVFVSESDTVPVIFYHLQGADGTVSATLEYRMI